MVIEPSEEQPLLLSDEQFGALLATGRWVRSAQRQEERLQDAWVRWVEVRSRYPASELQIPGVVPADLHDADERLADEMHYLLIAAHHALRKGPELVEKTGLSLPSPETSTEVAKLLRNVSEHWDEWHGPMTEPEHLRRWSTTRSGERLADLYPWISILQTGDGDAQRLNVIAGVLDMRKLRGDLERVRSAVRRWIMQSRRARPGYQDHS